jgi:DeoR family suf operon transcriptional repressor
MGWATVSGAPPALIIFRMPACQKSDSRYSKGMRHSTPHPVSPAEPVPPAEPRASDEAVIDLLRLRDALGIGELAESLGVTATAVRQRLDRLMRAGLIERSTVSKPRGRPSHSYRLTEAGRRLGGDNFRDLALVLWREIRGVRDPAIRSGLLGRIGSALAEAYRPAIRGSGVTERLESVAAILRERDICCSVTTSGGDGGLPVLTSHACPYPDLAEEDRGICAAERLMLQDLVGTTVRLDECRLDGGSVCRFVAGGCQTGGERVECPSVSLAETGGISAGSDPSPVSMPASSPRSHST